MAAAVPKSRYGRHFRLKPRRLAGHESALVFGKKDRYA
jgi:hypothetical protein